MQFALQLVECLVAQQWNFDVGWLQKTVRLTCRHSVKNVAFELSIHVTSSRDPKS